MEGGLATLCRPCARNAGDAPGRHGPVLVLSEFCPWQSSLHVTAWTVRAIRFPFKSACRASLLELGGRSWPQHMGWGKHTRRPYQLSMVAASTRLGPGLSAFLGRDQKPVWCKMAQLQWLLVLAPFPIAACNVTLDKALLCSSVQFSCSVGWGGLDDLRHV